MPEVYLIGSPVKHSLSPVIHNRAYAETKLDYHFSVKDVSTAELATFIQNLPPDCVGLAVTMPHKHQILRYLDVNEPMAATLQVVNTVVNEANLKTGFNTDVYGIRHTITTHLNGQQPSSAVILGAGATAISGLMAVAEMGIKQISIIARNFTRPPSIMKIASTLGLTPQLIPWQSSNQVKLALAKNSLLISTIPTQALAELINAHAILPDTTVVDIDYAGNTQHTKQTIEQNRAVYLPGTEVLLHQAVSQFSLHTGLNAPTEAMREALLTALKQ